MKNFLKPTIAKIWLSIAFWIVFSLAFLFWEMSNRGVCLSMNCPTVGEIALRRLFSISFFILIMSYLLSCISVIGLSRLRKKIWKRKTPVEKPFKKRHIIFLILSYIAFFFVIAISIVGGIFASLDVPKIDRTCNTDFDCIPHKCCGVKPMCVNKNSKIRFLEPFLCIFRGFVEVCGARAWFVVTEPIKCECYENICRIKKESYLKPTIKQ